MKAIAKYPGSKWSLADWIIRFFPKHHSYLEPFFGSGAVLFINRLDMGSGLVKEDGPAAKEQLQVAMVIWEKTYNPPGQLPFTAWVFHHRLHASITLLSSSSSSARIIP